MSESVLSVPASNQSPLLFDHARSMASRISVLMVFCASLFLAFPHRVQAAAFTHPIVVQFGDPIIAVGEYAGTYITDEVDFWFAESPVTSSWTGSGEVVTVYYPNVGYVAGASLLAVTPGVFDYTVVVDWSNHYLNDGIASELCRTTNVYPAAFTVVDVTNVTASAYHVAEGAGPITLTAQMTPVNAPDKVFWELLEGGGEFSTTQGLTTQFYPYGWVSSNVVACRWGPNRTEVVIHIYRVTGITATPQPAVAGQPITLTAITEPAGCPLPITWNIGTDTGTTITNAFGPGTHTVIASLGAGTITQTLNVVSVGVKEILYEWPASSDNWLPWSGLATGFPPLPSTAAVAVGSSFRVKAMPEPEGAEFPAGWPVWSGAASGSGPIATATFATVSTNLSDYQSVTATSGTSSRTEQAVVFGLDSILVATNHVAIGTNTLTLTPQMKPSSGGEHLVVWDCTNATLTLGSGASVEFPTDQAGIFTVTATCGGSSASTNLFVYRLASIAASADPVGEGDPVGISVTTEPTGCPLPVIWNVTADTNLSITVAFAAGTHSVIASLGTPESATQLTVNSVGVLAIQYEASPNSGNWSNWPAQPYFPKAVGFRVKALPKPAGATFPSGKPVWGGDASGTGDIGTISWGSVSTNLGDLRLVTASSGTSVTKSAVAYEAEVNIVPEHAFPGRSLAKFGVGETLVVGVIITPAALQLTSGMLGTWTWEANDANDGEWSSTTLPDTAYFGPLNAQEPTLTVTHTPVTLPGAQLVRNKKANFIKPSIRFSPYEFNAAGVDCVGHTPNGWHLDIRVLVKVTPSDVSWKGIHLREIGGQAMQVENRSFFGPMEGFLHESMGYTRKPIVRSLEWGWVMSVTDKTRGGPWIPGGLFSSVNSDSTVSDFADDSMSWMQIPWVYSLARRPPPPNCDEVEVTRVDQTFTSFSSGSSRLMKAFVPGAVTRGVLGALTTAVEPPITNLD
jgi:hypothetical protein